MILWHAIVLGIIEGVTEFLPISSTGHLTITELLLGYKIDDPGVTAFTAIIQIGAILAVLVYFRHDIAKIVKAWCSGIVNSKKRANKDYRYGWIIIVGSLPIMIVGFLLKKQIGEGVMRSLWVVAIALIVWGIVMFIADRHSPNERREADVTLKDALIIGAAQCLALIPGVSRSGATISAGLFRGFDRVAIVKLSFLLGIPALVAAGGLGAVTYYEYIAINIGWGTTLVATATAFISAYIMIAWLLKFLTDHNFSLFVWYRIGLGVLLIALLTTGVITST